MRRLTYLSSILFFIFSILISLTPLSYHAKAITEYKRIITEDTPFYSDKDGAELLFNLPYTYYVKILEEGEKFSHVECFGTGGSIAIDGYVPTDKLFDDDLPVPNPYMEKEITTISTAVLYADKSRTTPLQYVFSSRQLKYYGQAIADDGSILFYVGYNNRLGYVEEKNISPFELPLHPNELTFLIQSPETETPSLPEQTEEIKPKDNLMTIRIIVIVCLLLAGLVALFIALKNKPTNKIDTEYYDENEYE